MQIYETIGEILIQTATHTLPHMPALQSPCYMTLRGAFVHEGTKEKDAVHVHQGNDCVLESACSGGRGTNLHLTENEHRAHKKKALVRGIAALMDTKSQQRKTEDCRTLSLHPLPLCLTHLPEYQGLGTFV